MGKLSDYIKAQPYQYAINLIVIITVVIHILMFIFYYNKIMMFFDSMENGYYPQGTLLSDVNPNASTVMALSSAALPASWTAYNIDGYTPYAQQTLKKYNGLTTKQLINLKMFGNTA